MNDPYSVLGVRRDSSDEEIKKAYRDLARKYHPDRYTNSPDLAEVANEKMKEINAAYEAITGEREGRGSTASSSSYGGYSYGNPYGNPYGGQGYGQRSSNDRNANLYQEVRRMINESDLINAEARLGSVHEGDRGAEWCYLFACVLVKKGSYSDAGYYFDRACSMDPYNMEYNTARRNFKSRFSTQSPYGQTSDGCTACDICQILICMDCCCNGGGC